MFILWGFLEKLAKKWFLTENTGKLHFVATTEKNHKQNCTKLATKKHVATINITWKFYAHTLKLIWEIKKNRISTNINKMATMANPQT